ncbi:MAG: CinA family nicotinamide mononucleotide deamidase-related protein [Thermodesulfobacteriota bacterium]
MNLSILTPSCEILTVGTELLLGRVLDTNSSDLARALGLIGIRVRFRTAVGDRMRDMEEAVLHALTRCDLVILTGGLGPTEDDLTREAVARVSGVDLEFRQELMDRIEAVFQKIGYRMPENNRKQAYIPAGSLAVPNPVGTAPGFIAEIDGKPVVCLPGVPHELKYLMETRISPWLKKRFSLDQSRVYTRVLRVVGMGESKVDRLVGDLMKEGRNPEVALLASEGEIQVQITAQGSRPSELKESVEILEREIRSRLGRKIYGADDETLEGVVGGLLKDQGVSLALVDTFTSGRLAARLHDLEGSPVLSSIVLPNREAVAVWLGCEPPLELEDTARLLARNARQRAGAEVGLAVAGFPGPEKEQGGMIGVVAIEGAVGTRTFSWQAGGPLAMMRRRGAAIGLNTLRISLLESHNLRSS